MDNENKIEYEIGTYAISKTGELFKVIVIGTDIKCFQNVKNKKIKLQIELKN